MKIDCTVSTPIFIDGIISRYHRQSGVYNTKTRLFTPHLFLFGNHSIRFKNKIKWREACYLAFDQKQERKLFELKSLKKWDFSFEQISTALHDSSLSLNYSWILRLGPVEIRMKLTEFEKEMRLRRYVVGL